MSAEVFPALWDKILLAFVLGLGVILFARRVFTILRLVRSGRAENRLDQPWERLSIALIYIFGQTRVLRNRYVGIAHAVIFYGFLVMSLATINVVWRAFFDGPFLPGLTQSPYFVGLVDIFAVMVIVAVLASAYRRHVVHPPEVHNSFGSTLILGLIFMLMVTLLTTEAAEYLIGSSSVRPPVGALLSVTFSGFERSSLTFIQAIAWWLHILSLVGFLVFIPYSKHMHLLICPFNEFLRTLRPKGQLLSADVDSPNPIGAGTFSQFTWKQMLDLFSCTECGRCLRYCPAYASGKPLAPRQLILDLRNSLVEHAGNVISENDGPSVVSHSTKKLMVADVIGRESVWACTTCRACQEQCPVSVEHIDRILDVRRFLLDSEGVSPTLSRVLEGLKLLGNPQMLPPSERMSGMEKLRIPSLESLETPEIVYWLGCAAAYEPKVQENATALVKILKAANVDFAVVGSSERCCGDPARRVGEEGLFEELAKQNIENLERLGVKKLLTNCPHCFNTFSNEYPKLGAKFSVVHHSDYILELLAAKRIELNRPFDKPVTFHDPCYLGRYNGIYDSPREILRLACKGELMDMPRSRDKAFCCGGGGGQMYLESSTGTKINRLRFAEAQGLPVSLVATACPFCKIMLDDAARYDSETQGIQVRDIAELVCESIPL